MYIKQLAICGCILMIEKYHTYRYSSGRGRGKNINQTTDVQKRINQRHASRRRVMKACCNFHKGDYFIRLGYYAGESPATIDEAHKNLCKFLKACKRKYPDLKYMGVTELGSRGGLHHHILVPADFDMNLLTDFWKGSFQKSRTYTEELSQLASYLTKGECADMFEEERAHTEIEKKYTASRNLAKPEIEKQIVKKSEHWSDVPRSITYKGKIYDFKPGSDWNGFTKDGYEYQHYIMIERPPQRRQI